MASVIIIIYVIESKLMAYTGDIIKDKLSTWDIFATKAEVRNFYIPRIYAPQLFGGSLPTGPSRNLCLASISDIEKLVNDYNSVAATYYSTKAEVTEILCIYILILNGV